MVPLCSPIINTLWIDFFPNIYISVSYIPKSNDFIESRLNTLKTVSVAQISPVMLLFIYQCSVLSVSLCHCIQYAGTIRFFELISVLIVFNELERSDCSTILSLYTIFRRNICQCHWQWKCTIQNMGNFLVDFQFNSFNLRCLTIYSM